MTTKDIVAACQNKVQKLRGQEAVERPIHKRSEMNHEHQLPTAVGQTCLTNGHSRLKTDGGKNLVVNVRNISIQKNRDLLPKYRKS